MKSKLQKPFLKNPLTPWEGILNVIAFKELEVEKFSPHIFGRDYRAVGCGLTAISTITGENPTNLYPRYKEYVKDFPEEVVISHLLDRGFIVKPVTLNAKGEYNDDHLVSNKHVILAVTRPTKAECSWAILYGDMFYHNYDISPLTSVTLINCPVSMSWVVWHPSWSSKRGKDSIVKIYATCGLIKRKLKRKKKS